MITKPDVHKLKASAVTQRKTTLFRTQPFSIDLQLPSPKISSGRPDGCSIAPNSTFTTLLGRMYQMSRHGLIEIAPAINGCLLQSAALPIVTMIDDSFVVLSPNW